MAAYLHNRFETEQLLQRHTGLEMATEFARMLEEMDLECKVSR